MNIIFESENFASLTQGKIRLGVSKLKQKYSTGLYANIVLYHFITKVFQ